MSPDKIRQLAVRELVMASAALVEPGKESDIALALCHASLALVYLNKLDPTSRHANAALEAIRILRKGNSTNG